MTLLEPVVESRLIPLVQYPQNSAGVHHNAGIGGRRIQAL